MCNITGSYGSLPRGGSGGAAVVGYGSTPAAAAPERQTIGGVQHGAAPEAMGQYRPDQRNFVGMYRVLVYEWYVMPGYSQIYHRLQFRFNRDHKLVINCYRSLAVPISPIWFKHILFITRHDKGLGSMKSCLALFGQIYLFGSSLTQIEGLHTPNLTQPGLNPRPVDHDRESRICVVLLTTEPSGTFLALFGRNRGFPQAFTVKRRH